MVHAHITAWSLTIILFLISYFLLKKGNDKGLRILQMVLRLFYIIVLATGGHLLGTYMSGSMIGMAIVKAVIGLWVIFSMEFILTRGKKGEKTGIFWTQFILSFLLVLFFGYYVLPL